MDDVIISEDTYAQYVCNAMWYDAYSNEDEEILRNNDISAKEIYKPWFDKTNSSIVINDRWNRKSESAIDDIIGRWLIDNYQNYNIQLPDNIINALNDEEFTMMRI